MWSHIPRNRVHSKYWVSLPDEPDDALAVEIERCWRLASTHYRNVVERSKKPNTTKSPSGNNAFPPETNSAPDQLIVSPPVCRVSLATSHRAVSRRTHRDECNVTFASPGNLKDRAGKNPECVKCHDTVQLRVAELPHLWVAKRSLGGDVLGSS